MGYGPFGMPGVWTVRAGNEPSPALGVLPDTREALALDHAEC